PHSNQAYGICLTDAGMIVLGAWGGDGERYWNLLGGGVEPGETLEDCLVREVLPAPGSDGGRLRVLPYPADRERKRLIAELTSHSPRFAELWDSGQADSPRDQSRHKIIDH